VTTTAHSFGPFTIDLRAHRLLRDGVAVELSAHLLDVLVHLVEHAGDLVSREQLLETFWPDVFVTDNTITRAISDLRRALGDDARSPRYIQTTARRGYRFVAATRHGTEGHAAVPDGRSAGEPADGQASLFDAPELRGLRDLVGTIPDLETFDATRLPAAIERLQAAAAGLPRYAPVHVALASAGALSFIAHRRTVHAREALNDAVRHGQLACELDPHLSEAWATLAFVLTVEGRNLETARTAARRAVMIDAGSWRNHFRLAFASWGDERLRAVSRTLALLPGMPFACLIGAMVHTARSAFPAALDLLDQASAGGAHATSRLPAAGVDWLRGALLWQAGTAEAHAAAVESVRRELARHEPTRLYSTEFAVDAWVWRAGWSYARRNPAAAVAELEEALTLDPSHARSAVAAAALAGLRRTADAPARRRRADDLLSALTADGQQAEATSCAALDACLRDDFENAVALLENLLAHAPDGHTGWTIPVDPWFTALRGRAGFDQLLRTLAQRAA
jgi:DNA-binding winged helix-turn-helix (wHTH) protein/tetratricopeptide (TPR) repeat protein